MIQSLNFQFLGMILFLDLESLFKLCDINEICVGFQFQSAASNLVRITCILLIISLKSSRSIHHFTQILVALKGIFHHFNQRTTPPYQLSGAPNGNFRENICSEDYLRTRTTTCNLPGPSGTRDCIDIVYLSYPSPLLCGG